MRILLPKSHGMCFGVRDALTTTESIENPADVTIYGELVHNERVQARVKGLGFRIMTESERVIPSSPAVLITAHGVSGAERARLAGAALDIIDTTCPLVRHAHSMARLLDAEDRLVLVVGETDHVEVRGIVGDLRRYRVIESAEAVVNFDTPRLGVVSQTTTTERVFQAAVDAIREKNPDADVKILSTICAPTRDRQRALETLLREVDALVVVGGSRSRNSLELVTTAERAGVRAILVQGSSDLDRRWFGGVSAVGLTAGTSTLQETLDEVHAALIGIARAHETAVVS